MQHKLYHRWWILFTIFGIVGLTLFWRSPPPRPKALPIPPIPSHSNTRLLPFAYWNHRSLYPDMYTDRSCVDFPKLNEIQYASSSWQLLKVENGSVYVYGAYWDDRFDEPLVRILVYTDVTPIPKLYCQLWYPNDNEPQTELAEVTYGWNPAWGGPTNGVNEPYVLSCRASRHSPEAALAPIAAAVVTAPCGPVTNALNIQNAPFDDYLDFSKTKASSPRNRTSVAVCLKWLHYRNDVSAQLVEWLQLLKNFGVDNVYLYITRVHPNIRKVVNYFESTGFVVATEHSHPPQVSGRYISRGDRDFLDMRRELLPLNDCLYRNLRRHDWLAAIDMDEMIVPDAEETWPELVDREASAITDGQPVDAFIFLNYYLLDDAQKDLVGPARARMLSHTWRAKTSSPSGWYVKSFINTSSVITMHNHTPMSCNTGCQNRDLTSGKLMHYRHKCGEDAADCEALHDVVRDHSFDKIRSKLLKEIDEVLAELGLEKL